MSDLTAVSLFAGIEAFGLAFDRSGVDVVAAVEIDQDCRGVIARHFPDTTLFGDVTEVTGEQLRNAGFTPRRGIITAGFPCQDLSVAGRRAGLGGARSGLFWDIVRLADELLPQWLVLENVPGLLSAVCACSGDETCLDNGRAIRCGRWEKRDGKRTWLDHVSHTPQGGTCPGGCMELHGGAMGSVVGALEQLGYGLCWRVLDSRYFSVAQRRERVFIVGCLGDGAAPVEVLLEPESGGGHPAASGAAWPDIAGTLGSRAGGSRTTDLDGHGACITVATLQGGGRRGHRADAEGAAGGHLIPFDTAQITSSGNRANPKPGDPAPTLNGSGQLHVAPFPSRDVSHAITSREGKGADSDATSGPIVQPVALRGRDSGGQIEIGEPGAPAFTLRTPGGGGSYPMIAHSLTSEGADASEDGTGRGTPIVVAGQVAATLTSGRAVGNGVRDPGRRSEDDVDLVPMAFNPQSGGGKARIGYGETPTALQASQVTGVMQPMAVSENQRGEVLETAYSRQMTTGGGKPGQGYPAVRTGTAVRRLTPKECERLQALPDEWTRWKLVSGKLVEQSDSARYRQVGNSLTVNVAHWIARRIVAVHERRAAA